MRLQGASPIQTASQENSRGHRPFCSWRILFWTPSHWIWDITIPSFFLRWVLSKYFENGPQLFIYVLPSRDSIHTHHLTGRMGFPIQANDLENASVLAWSHRVVDSVITFWKVELSALVWQQKQGFFEARQIPALPVISCVILAKFLNLSVLICKMELTVSSS